MFSQLLENCHFLKKLAKAKTDKRKVMLALASPSQIKNLQEICRNLVAYNLPMKTSDWEALVHGRYKKQIKACANETMDVEETRKCLISRGGFLPVIIPPTFDYIKKYQMTPENKRHLLNNAGHVPADDDDDNDDGEDETDSQGSEGDESDEDGDVDSDERKSWCAKDEEESQDTDGSAGEDESVISGEGDDDESEDHEEEEGSSESSEDTRTTLPSHTNPITSRIHTLKRPWDNAWDDVKLMEDLYNPKNLKFY